MMIHGLIVLMWAPRLAPVAKDDMRAHADAAGDGLADLTSSDENDDASILLPR